MRKNKVLDTNISPRSARFFLLKDLSVSATEIRHFARILADAKLTKTQRLALADIETEVKEIRHMLKQLMTEFD